MERKVRDSCGKSTSSGDPAGARRRGPTARGKRVPVVEMDVHFTSANKTVDKRGFPEFQTKLIGTKGARLLREKRV
ncbi:hypothetical protein ACQKML_19395 [Peribacillus frigoritolerans]